MSQHALGQQFQQLPMFMEAQELRNSPSITHGDAMFYKDKDAMWRRKLDQANQPERHYDPDTPMDFTKTRPSLRESVGQGGVREPVQLRHGTDRGTVMFEGHHRTAAAYDHNPRSLVPVLHDEYSYKPPVYPPGHEGLGG